MTVEISARRAAAEDIARKAGALALKYFHNRDSLAIEAKRTLQDMVTEADREVEVLIRAELAKAFPTDAILGEEFGLSPGTSGLTWVIDPIDGTAPFLAGLPGWCVSISVMDDRLPVVGVINAPVLQEIFVAAKGQGTTCNGKPVTVTTQFDLQNGLLGIGANDRVSPDDVGEMLARLMAAGASWTRYGSGALMLAYVAAGRLVGYVEPRMNAWDCMAGYCLITEAGGRVLAFPVGDRLALPAPVLASRADIFDEVLTLTQIEDVAIWGKF